MSHKKDPSNSKETLHSDENSQQVLVVDASEGSDSLDSEVGLVGEQVSEVAKENASEQSKGGQAKGKHVVTNQKKKDVTLEERLMLRERLLEAAPKTPTMRREVQEVLLSKKTKLQKSIGRLNRSREYELLSRAIAELRQVVHQIELVAHASYEILKEIWLKVVQKFA